MIQTLPDTIVNPARELTRKGPKGTKGMDAEFVPGTGHLTGTMWLRRLVVPVLAMGVLAGCSSPATVYYTLSAPSAEPAVTSGAPVRQVAQGGSSTPVAYRINSVTVPAQVDDTPLVVRQSPDQLMVLTFDRWSGPLSDQVRDALSQALTREMGVPPLQNLGSAATASTQRTVSQVSVDVQRFDLLPGQAALMNVAWQVDVPGRGRQAAHTLTCYSEFRTVAATGVAPLVAAQQTNVIKLASQIGQALNAQTVDGARCF